MTATLERPANVAVDRRTVLSRDSSECKAKPQANELTVDVASQTYTLRPLGTWCLEHPEIVRLIADFPTAQSDRVSGDLQRHLCRYADLVQERRDRRP